MKARKWDARHLAGARVKVRYDQGTDAGGLSRHLFTEFGKGLEFVCGVTRTCDKLLRVQALVKDWEPSTTVEDEQLLMREVSAALSQQHLRRRFRLSTTP